MKKSLSGIICLCTFLLLFASCEKNKEEKAFAMKFAEAIAQKDTARIDSMMGTKGVFAWGETQIAAVNIDSLKLEEAGENQFKVTLGGGKSFCIATAAGDNNAFHVLQPRGFFTVDTMLVNALSKRGEIEAGDDDAAIANKVKAVKEKATKMDGKTYVGNVGFNFYFLKKGSYSGYETAMWQYSLATGETQKINLAKKLETIDIAMPDWATFEDYVLVGNKLVLATSELGILGYSPHELVSVDLGTLKVKEITYGNGFKFSKDKKSVTVTDIVDMNYSNGYPEPITKERTVRLDNLK